MANRYVYSGATGTGTGADWTNAHTTLAAAITASTAGDTFFVAHDHAETTAAALTLTFKGTSTAPDRVLAVNRAGSVPPVAADLVATPTATVTTTGANAMTLISFVYIYGIAFSCGTGASITSLLVVGGGAAHFVAENCQFRVPGTTGGNNNITLNGSGSGSGRVRLINCQMYFGSVASGIKDLGGEIQWTNNGVNALATSSLVPTTFINGNMEGPITLSGVDLSSFGSGKTLFTSTSYGFNPMRLVNCLLAASVSIGSALSGARSYFELINCNLTGGNVRNERYLYTGTLTSEYTIVRTGGATDGVAAFSWKIVTTTGANHDALPFETFEGVLWNTTIGSAKTLTVHVVTDNVTLKDSEVWLEIEYLGASANTLTTLASDSNATVLTTGANQATSTATWTTTGLTTPIKQSLDVTFTPQRAGLVRWRVRVAKTSATVYICPKADLT